MSQQLACKVTNLSVQYDNHVAALTDVNLAIPTGVRAAIIGPNGAGKSTLFKSILGFEKAKTGSIELLGQTEQLNEVISKHIAYIPQLSTVNWQFPATVFDVALMGRYPHIHSWLKKPNKIDKELTEHALEKMKLIDLKDRHITELSGGQKQRVFIARALAQDASLYLMDEPLAGIDIQTEEIIMNTLKQFQQEGKTSIVIHHDLNTVPTYFDYVLFLNKTIIAEGLVTDVFTKENYQTTYQTVGLSQHKIIDFANTQKEG